MSSTTSGVSTLPGTGTAPAPAAQAAPGYVSSGVVTTGVNNRLASAAAPSASLADGVSQAADEDGSPSPNLSPLSFAQGLGIAARMPGAIVEGAGWGTVLAAESATQLGDSLMNEKSSSTLGQAGLDAAGGLSDAVGFGVGGVGMVAVDAGQLLQGNQTIIPVQEALQFPFL
jgi:hypothetical protein